MGGLRHPGGGSAGPGKSNRHPSQVPSVLSAYLYYSSCFCPSFFGLFVFRSVCPSLSSFSAFLFPSMFVSSLFTFCYFSVCLSLHSLSLLPPPPPSPLSPPCPIDHPVPVCQAGWDCQPRGRCGWAWCPPLLRLLWICGCAFFIWGCSCPLSSGFRTRDRD